MFWILPFATELQYCLAAFNLFEQISEIWIGDNLRGRYLQSSPCLHVFLVPVRIFNLRASQHRRHTLFNCAQTNSLLKRNLMSKMNQKEEPQMLWTISLILIVLWVLGMVSSYTMGGFIHILLVIAVVTLLLRLISGRRIA